MSEIPLADRVYREASLRTGKSEAQLRTMALNVFASILFHAMDLDGRTVWSACRLQGKHVDMEVNTGRQSPIKL